MQKDYLIHKKILFVCRETYSMPLWFLAKELKECNEVAAFFIMSTECSYNKCYYNENSYYKYKEELPDVKLYDVRDICDTYTKELKEKGSPMDMDYLDMLEREYTHFKNLNLQLMSSQENTKHYHYRDYWSVTTYEENVYWLELNYKKIIGILEEFKPDVILDFDNAELQRTIMNEVAYKKQIPYITVEYGKYGAYKYPTFQNTIGIDDYFRKLYKENLARSPQELKWAYDYVAEYRQANTIMSKEFAGSVTSQYERDSLIWIARVMHGKWNYFWNMDITNKNLKIKRTNKVLYAPSVPYFFHYLSVELKKRKLFGKNKYFEDPVPGEDYVYMPLHLIPESTVFVKASFYIDELNLIEQVSKSLPVGWKLYVKEHQAMLGERGLEFYKKAAEIHNVRVVQLNYYKDPKPWIANAKGVVTIVGTTSYEAALLGKRSIVFGEVPFSLIDGISVVKDFEQLPELIREFDKGIEDNVHSCAAYLQSVKDAGVELRNFYLMEEAEKILAGKHEAGDEFRKELANLKDFYNKGIETWNQTHDEAHQV